MEDLVIMWQADECMVCDAYLPPGTEALRWCAIHNVWVCKACIPPIEVGTPSLPGWWRHRAWLN